MNELKKTIEDLWSIKKATENEWLVSINSKKRLWSKKESYSSTWTSMIENRLIIKEQAEAVTIMNILDSISSDSFSLVKETSESLRAFSPKAQIKSFRSDQNE